MPSKEPAVEVTLPAAPPALTDTQIVAAATNSPSMSSSHCKVGDRTFTLVDLEYEEYLEFFSHLEPLLKSVASVVTQRAGVSVPGLEADLKGLDASFLMKFCGKSLPEMATLVLNMEEKVIAAKEDRPPDILKLVDVKWVKKHGKNPMVLAGVVMQQIAKNNMIVDFLDFFVQVLPTVMKLSELTKK